MSRLCDCCVKFLIGSVLTDSVQPRYYLVAFSLLTTNSSSNFSSFQLEIENKNRQIGIYHNDIALTLLAGPNLSFPICHSVVPAFYQGRRKKAEKPGNFSGISEGNRTRVVGESLFRVLVNSAFRYKVLGWKSRHHAVSLTGEVEVDAGGKKTGKKGIGCRRPAQLLLYRLSLLLYSCVLYFYRRDEDRTVEMKSWLIFLFVSLLVKGLSVNSKTLIIL